MFKFALILSVGLEAASFAGFLHPPLSLPLLIIIGAAAFFLSLKNLEWGVYILFGELFVGSRGRLLEYDFLSLRMVVFAAVFLAWVLRIFFTLPLPLPSREGNKKEDSSPLPGLRSHFGGVGRGEVRWGWVTKSYWLLLLVIGFGILNGYFRGNGFANIFNDVNGYLYLLILPAVISVISKREQINNLLKILAAAIAVIAVKTLILFMWFVYDGPGVANLYHWIVEQDIGEITGVVGSASRIFMQSQFWALMGLFIFSISFLSLRGGRPTAAGADDAAIAEIASLPLAKTTQWLIVSAALLSVIMSLSRSFWLGAIAGGIFALIMLLAHFKVGFKQVFSLGLKLFLIAAVEIACLYLLVSFSGGGFAESISSRTVNPSKEAAGGARLLLLPELLASIKQAPIIGKGFGQQVTYKSYLPDRVSAENPDGEITSFAFEWGYLDTALKIGSLGLVIYLLFIARIFAHGWKAVNMEYGIWNMGLLASLVALLTLNVTTPYLNHPLGIGYLIILYSIFHILNSRHEAAG